MKAYKIDLKQVAFYWQEILPGCPGASAIVAVHHCYPTPIATAWYRHTLLHQIEIIDCYVGEQFRRQGLMRALVGKLREWWPGKTICTAICNKLSTPAFKRIGFKQKKGGWYL
jgi:GNAT superfamily N-acetyltransferase